MSVSLGGTTACDCFRKGNRNLEFYMGNKDLSRKVGVTSQHLLESYKCP